MDEAFADPTIALIRTQGMERWTTVQESFGIHLVAVVGAIETHP
jgi:hypothetical protein